MLRFRSICNLLASTAFFAFDGFLDLQGYEEDPELLHVEFIIRKFMFVLVEDFCVEEGQDIESDEQRSHQDCLDEVSSHRDHWKQKSDVQLQALEESEPDDGVEEDLVLKSGDSLSILDRDGAVSGV